MTRSKDVATGSRSPTDVDRVVGENLRRIRQMRSKTLSDLANDLGISHQQLQKYETAANRLSAGMLDKVATQLGVTIAELFRRDGEEKKSGAAGRAAARIEALKEEGGWLLANAPSEQGLIQMVEVLRVLSRKG